MALFLLGILVSIVPSILFVGWLVWRMPADPPITELRHVQSSFFQEELVD